MKNPKRYYRITREKKRIRKVISINANHNSDQRVYWSSICKYLDLRDLVSTRLTCHLLYQIRFLTVKDRFKCDPHEVYYPEVYLIYMYNFFSRFKHRGLSFLYIYQFNQENVKRIQLPQIEKKINNKQNYGRKRQSFR